MLKPILFLLVGVAVGGLAATWRSSTPDAPALDDGPGAAGLAARVEALERAQNRETLRRAELEGALEALSRQVARAPAAAPAPDGETRTARAADRADEDVEAGRVAEPPELARRRFGRDGAENLTARLVEAGFSPDRAGYINARTEALRMEALQAQYEARRDGVPPTGRARGSEALRTELGDAEFELYLEAVGRPTRVRVGGVLASSPAEHAGLAPGDEVVAYGGRRVFDMRDLNELILEGRPGEPVIVDVLRDGQPIQVLLPRGPLGISGRGR